MEGKYKINVDGLTDEEIVQEIKKVKDNHITIVYETETIYFDFLMRMFEDDRIPDDVRNEYTEELKPILGEYTKGVNNE